MLIPEEVLAMLNEIGKTVFVTKMEYHARTCYHVDYVLSNGWELRIFDECQGDYDYIEEIKPPGGEWIDLYDDANYDHWQIINNHFGPPDAALKELRLGNETPMTPKEALLHLINEFVGRFNCDAESCTDYKKTHEAIRILTTLHGIDNIGCPGLYCNDKH